MNRNSIIWATITMIMVIDPSNKMKLGELQLEILNNSEILFTNTDGTRYTTGVLNDESIDKLYNDVKEIFKTM